MALVRPTETGWSGFWQLTGDFTQHTALPNAAGGNTTPFAGKVARTFSGEQLREIRTVMIALLGAAAGGAALKTYKNVHGAVGPDQTVPLVSAIDALGGLRTIDVNTVINRVTTAADLAIVKKFFDGTWNASQMATLGYPVDPSGNGARTQPQGVAAF